MDDGRRIFYKKKRTFSFWGTLSRSFDLGIVCYICLYIREIHSMSKDKKTIGEGILYLVGFLAVVGMAYITYMVIMDDLIKF